MTSKEVERAMATYAKIFQNLHSHPIEVDEGFRLKYTSNKRSLFWLTINLLGNVWLVYGGSFTLLFLVYLKGTLPFPIWILGLQFFLAVFGITVILANVGGFIFGEPAVGFWNHAITLQGTFYRVTFIHNDSSAT
jgi:hypothetical protein